MSRLLYQAELLRRDPWSPLTESNRRPSPYHGDALPTELRGRCKTDTLPQIRRATFAYPPAGRTTGGRWVTDGDERDRRRTAGTGARRAVAERPGRRRGGGPDDGSGGRRAVAERPGRREAAARADGGAVTGWRCCNTAISDPRHSANARGPHAVTPRTRRPRFGRRVDILKCRNSSPQPQIKSQRNFENSRILPARYVTANSAYTNLTASLNAPKYAHLRRSTPAQRTESAGTPRLRIKNTAVPIRTHPDAPITRRVNDAPHPAHRS